MASMPQRIRGMKLIGLGRGAEGPAAVKALAVLQGDDAVSQCLGRDDRV